MLFLKGGWELDESKKEAALRETIEEAGVRGIVGGKLGKWSFKSKTHDTFYEGYMFPLLVEEQHEFWPEQNVRQRTWMSVSEAREVCQHWWMKEALDRLVTISRNIIDSNENKPNSSKQGLTCFEKCAETHVYVVPIVGLHLFTVRDALSGSIRTL
ncbi:hypothetical protein S83_001089 [Arachis hypogaea]